MLYEVITQALPLQGIPQPDWGGVGQSYVMLGYPSASTFYIAMKTVDEMGNWSGLSNVVTLVTQASDTTAPAATTDLGSANPN